jgi:hypothetical protein
MINSIVRLLPLLVLVTTTISCQSHATRLYSQYPKTDPKTVDIINHLPSRDYILVADFQCVDATHRWIKNKAASYGADAVYLASFSGSTTQTGNLITQRPSNSGIYTQQFCSAIKYVSPE